MPSAHLTDLHMIVLSWINFHPGHTPEDIAKGIRAGDDGDESSVRTSDGPGSSSRRGSS